MTYNDVKTMNKTRYLEIDMKSFTYEYEYTDADGNNHIILMYDPNARAVELLHFISETTCAIARANLRIDELNDYLATILAIENADEIHDVERELNAVKTSVKTLNKRLNTLRTQYFVILRNEYTKI